MYSWLHCEPDDIFKPAHFAVGDVLNALPSQLLDFLLRLWHIMPGSHSLDATLPPLAQLAFTAKPMQVSSHMSQSWLC